MKKIFAILAVAFAFVNGAGSVNSADNAEKSAILPQKAEYKIMQIMVDKKTMEARDGATFGVDGKRIYGNTGCNGYFGDFRRDGTNIEINDNIGSTRMMCDKMANTFERVFLLNLTGRFSVSENEGKIILSNDKIQIVLMR